MTNNDISDRAIVETNHIGNDVTVHPFAVIRPDVIIGDNVIIHPHVVIESGVEIGAKVEIFPGAYIGKEPKGAGATARTPSFERYVKIGENSSIGPNAVIYYGVTIGQNTLVGDNASIREEVQIGDFCIISRGVTINYNTSIGNRTKIMDLTHITGNCLIGDDVFISTMVSTVNDNAIGKSGYDDNRTIGPRIGHGAAVGAGATILPNITIGEGSIIGASALVTKNVAPHKLALGSPARIVKDLEPQLSPRQFSPVKAV